MVVVWVVVVGVVGGGGWWVGEWVGGRDVGVGGRDVGGRRGCVGGRVGVGVGGRVGVGVGGRVGGRVGVVGVVGWVVWLVGWEAGGLLFFVRGRGRAVAVAVAMAMAMAGRVVGIAGWPDGRLAVAGGRWSGVSLVAGCWGVRVSGWPGGRVAGWPWLVAAVAGPAGWPWPGGRVAAALAAVCHPLAYQAACLFVHFGEFTHTHQCQLYTQARSKAASLRSKRRASSVADAHATDEPVA